MALGRVYDNVALRNPSAAAHTISDEIHQTQSGLRGVARTKLTFISDRDNERVVDTVETRNGKEVYVTDYDGANQMRVTSNRRLNMTPSWSPDGRSIAYSSYTKIHPQIIVSNVYQGTRETLTDEKSSAFMPVFSPDGNRIAFMSQRDGNPEIYVMNRDGSGVRRLTNHSAADSDADVVADGYADRVHVGPFGLAADLGDGRRRVERSPHYLRRILGRPRDLVAGALQRDRVLGAIRPRIRHQDFRCRRRKRRSRSPTAWAPTKVPRFRRTAATSHSPRRVSGKVQIFTMARDGKNLRQVTRTGNNTIPELVAITRIHDDNSYETEIIDLRLRAAARRSGGVPQEPAARGAAHAAPSPADCGHEAAGAARPDARADAARADSERRCGRAIAR